MNKAALGILMMSLLMVAGNFSGNAVGNTNPVDTSKTGAIVPDNDTPIYMKSENITTSLNSDEAKETVEYVLKNSENSTVYQELLLPFEYRRIFRDSSLVDSMDFRINNHTCSASDYDWANFYWQSPGSSGKIRYKGLHYNLSFRPFEEIRVSAHYPITFNADERVEYGYLTLTGTLWNHPIEEANFTYFIKNDLQHVEIKGLDGYKETDAGDHRIIHKEFTNWTPVENVNITWEQPETTIGFPDTPLILMVITAAFLLDSWKKEDSSA